MIITVTLNPALDKTLSVCGFSVGQVNRVQTVRQDPGGKGINVSKSVQALGGETLSLSILGGGAGEYIKSSLDAMDLPNDAVWTETETRTNTKIVDMQEHTYTDINEPGHGASRHTLDAVWEKIKKYAGRGDTVVFAGKNPPGTPDTLIAEWMKALHVMGVRVCVDTVGEPMQQALLNAPDIIKPNMDELRELTGKNLKNDAEVLEAARELTKSGVGMVVVSMGADGAIFVTNEEAIRSHCPKVKVVSTVGAGDAMMAALAYYSQMGCPLSEIARRATATATATVTVSGTQPAKYEDVLCLTEKITIENL